MKIPTNSNAISYGLMYGIASKDHTFFYEGWDKNSIAQYNRVVRAKFCEHWITEFCNINGIECSGDGSHFTKSDEYDIQIGKYKFDIKSSIRSDYIQVNAALKEKDITGYIFCRTNDNMDMIEVKGIISKEKFYNSAIFVAHGEETPDGWDQSFKNGSYFLHSDMLTSKGLDSIYKLKQQ